MDVEVKQRNRRRKRAQRMQAQREINKADHLDGDSGDEDVIQAKPPRPPNRRKKSKEPLCEEDIVEGFSILQFRSYEDLELVLKIAVKENIKRLTEVERPKIEPKAIITNHILVQHNHGLTLTHDPATSDDSGRASERLTGSSVAPRDADSSRDRLSDASSRCSSGKGYICDSEGEDDKDSGSEEVEAEISQNQNLLPNEGNTSNTIVPPSSDSEPPNSQPGPSTAPCIGKKTKCSKRKVSTGDQRQEEAYNVLKELQAKKNRHKYSAFGEHVAMKMEALKSSYAQNVVEHEISNILFQASIGKYDYPATGHSGQMTPISTHSSSSSFPIHPPLSSPDDTSSLTSHYNQLLSPQYVSSPSPQYIPQVTESQTVPELRSPQYALPSSSQYIPQQTQDIPLTDSQTEQETSLAASSILLEAINTANILD